MIFLTVGTQLPFDRLVMAMDEWCTAPDAEKVFAQIGAGSYIPKHMEWARNLTVPIYREKCQACSAIVSHAGIGSVLSAQEFQKPVIIMPRQLEFGEHRNDHQMATAQHFSGIAGVTVVQNVDELKAVLSSGRYSKPDKQQRSAAHEQLIKTIREFIAA